MGFLHGPEKGLERLMKRGRNLAVLKKGILVRRTWAEIWGNQ